MSNQHTAGSHGQEAGRYMSSVKVGPKGQIVIPKEVREMFGIKPGDALLLLADIHRGIAMHRFDYFDKIADEIFLRAGGEPAMSKEKEDGLRFAEAVKETRKLTGEERK
jgi:AbrB family looped-hinge helix DNA binding protein